MRPHPSARFRLTAGVVAGATTLSLAALAGSSSASASTPRFALAGSAAAWLGQARNLGATPSSQKVDFGVLLRMRDQAGAAATLKAISEPGSARYGHWLTNAQFNARYGPAHSSVTAVQNWLRSQGFKVGTTLPSGMYIEASGSTAQVDKAFGTTMRNYTYRGATLHANATALSLASSTPAAVRAAMVGTIGLDQGATLKKPDATLPGPPPGARYGVQPCSAYYGQKTATDKPKAYGHHEPYVICGYTPQQYQSAFGENSMLKKGEDGHGVTVAITDAYAAPTILRDAQKYNEAHQQPRFAASQFSQSTPAANGYDMEKACGPQGWYGEETLDVEAVHAMAPGANVTYIGAKNCDNGLNEAWASAIDHHVADVITNSWNSGTDNIKALGEAQVRFYDQYSMEAALTGITVNFSSGDSGDDTDGGANLKGKTVEFPADEPYVTGVGGTSVYIGKNGQHLAEYGWQSDYTTLTSGKWNPAPPGAYSSGGGGGTSVLFGQPFYQKGRVPADVSKYWGKTPMRAVPDIAMPGDPNTGFEVGETQKFPDGTYWAQYRIGGTSLSSPLMAGVVAVADQFSGHSLGFINPLYYRMLGTPALHDITAPKKPQSEVRTDFANFLNGSQGKLYRLQTIDVQSTTLHDTPGYDDETGVGTPDGPSFFYAAASATGRRP